MKRLGLATFVVLALTAPVSALAAPADTVSVNIAGLQRGAVIEGTVPFEVEATSAAGIRRLDVFVGDATVQTVTPDNVRQKVTARHDWITSLAEGTSDVAPNGEYVVRAKAVANGGANKELIVRVIVDNPAATPSGLAAASSGGSVQLEWLPNPEPDILGYEIQRGDGTTFATVAQTADTFFEERVGSGTYSYRVVAVRHSAARSTGRPSPPSDPVDITIAAAGSGPGMKSGAQGGGSLGPRGRGSKVKDPSFAPRGLPGSVALPGRVGSVGLPDLPDPAVEWGTYEKELPYELPEGGIPLSADAEPRSSAPWKLPPDAMRWIGAGALLLLIAGGLLVIARRVEVAEPNEKLKL